MHESMEKLPVKMQAAGTTVRNLGGWGGMVVAHVELPAGGDFRPLLEGLPNDACQCPHWGYVLKGSMHWHYTDGTEEVVQAGEVFYAPPGHTVWVEEDTAYMDFSPEKELDDLWRHLSKKLNMPD